MLRFTDMTLEEIAIAVGMNGGNYFSRMFKKIEGITLLADYVIKNFAPEKRKIAVSFDSRIKSDVFAKVASGVFAANGIMAGVLVFKIYKKGKGRIRFSCILFIIYIEILMQTAFFSREPGSRQQIDLNLFGTWGQTAIAHAYFIENIIMFIPFGLLAPMVFERMRKVRFCVFIGFLCSCGIELSQLITQRGYCQLDDVVTNTVGMLVGWGIWKMLSSVGIAGNPLF